MENKNLNCKTCKAKCNKKGYPSAMKGSAFCQKQRKEISIERMNYYKKLEKNLQQMAKIIQKWVRHGK